MIKNKKINYINRELSWINFNHRVLDESNCTMTPVLEKLKFLAIADSNINEFFMVRVGGLLDLKNIGSRQKDISGLTVTNQLNKIAQSMDSFYKDMEKTYSETILPSLRSSNINEIKPVDLSGENKIYSENYFLERIFPALTPILIQKNKPMPLLRNLGLNILVRLKDGNANRFAVCPIGISLPRFITIPQKESFNYLLLEELIKNNIELLFPGKDILETIIFRITRNADMSVREEQAPDLIEGMTAVLDARKIGDCVRLEIQEKISKISLTYLKNNLGIKHSFIYNTQRPLKFSDFFALTGMDGFDELKEKPVKPLIPAYLAKTKSIFNEINKKDILLVHPFESFDPVVSLIEEAANDKDVIAIKQILYRTSKNSPIIDALKRAAEKGKSVTVLVELKARFDEERNIEWAKKLEQAGVFVVYGIENLKTHAKICLIVRKEKGSIRRYMHFGTGNYNEQTAKLYTDITLLTKDESLAKDASQFFNMITGFSQPAIFSKLFSAPLTMKTKFIELIENEIARKKQGQKAIIKAKFNSLSDPEIINALYQASNAGVKIQLNIRGICCLNPGIKGMSENIRVVSIIDKFLEHSRIYYFFHGGEEKVFISSADWMTRNLEKRIELLIPVEDKHCKNKLLTVLKNCLNDNVKGRQILKDNNYYLTEVKKSKTLRSQEFTPKSLYEIEKILFSGKQERFVPHTKQNN